MKKLRISNPAIPILIGKGGENIKNMNSRGCYIEVEKATGDVTLIGIQSEIDDAVNGIASCIGRDRIISMDTFFSRLVPDDHPDAIAPISFSSPAVAPAAVNPPPPATTVANSIVAPPPPLNVTNSGMLNNNANMNYGGNVNANANANANAIANVNVNANANANANMNMNLNLNMNGLMMPVMGGSNPLVNKVASSAAVVPPPIIISLPSEREIDEVLFFPEIEESSPNFNRFLRYLRSATKVLDICVFTITDNRISNALIDLHYKGVKINIITDDTQVVAQGSDILRLSQAGVNIIIDSSPAHMHHKFAIIDKTLLLNGSYNWTLSAERSNNENIIITNRTSLVKPFLNQFQLLWAKYENNMLNPGRK